MNLSRRQVKALLDVVSADEMRPILCRAEVQLFEDRPYLVATNSYMLAAIKLPEAFTDLVGHSITRQDLVKWYKLATGRDQFTEDNVRELATVHDGKYPEWQRLVPTGEAVPMSSMVFNADYCATMQVLADTKGLEWKYFGALAPMLAKTADKILIVMPMKNQ